MLPYLHRIFLQSFLNTLTICGNRKLELYIELKIKRKFEVKFKVKFKLEVERSADFQVFHI